MRPADLMMMALASLARHKARTGMTVLGVAIGAFTLIASLSVGNGVEAALLRMFRKNDLLRRIQIYQNYQAKEEDVPPGELVAKGAMSDAKRLRLRKMLLRRWEREHPQRQRPLLTKARLDEIARTDHVREVFPTVQMPLAASFEGQSRDAFLVGAEGDGPSLGSRIVAGSNFAKGAGRVALVHEALLYSWGITDDDDVRRVVGRTIRLEFRARLRAANPLLMLLTGGAAEILPPEFALLERALKGLPAALEKADMPAPERDSLKKALGALQRNEEKRKPATYVEEYTIGGVVREWEASDEPPGQVGFAGPAQQADLILPTPTAEAFYLRAPEAAEEGFYQAVVVVDREENVMALHKAFAASGLNVYSLADVTDQVRTNIVLITFATAFVAVVALVVASLGIANTMIMSVLERTREIGVMKAVGARDLHIQLLFLVEGGLVGLSGGVLGLALAWGASFPGDAYARAIMERQTKAPLDQSLFIFPPWIVLGVPAAAVAVTVLAALYPARRASRLDPIAALRYE